MTLDKCYTEFLRDFKLKWGKNGRRYSAFTLPYQLRMLITNAIVYGINMNDLEWFWTKISTVPSSSSIQLSHTWVCFIDDHFNFVRKNSYASCFNNCKSFDKFTGHSWQLLRLLCDPAYPSDKRDDQSNWVTKWPHTWVCLGVHFSPPSWTRQSIGPRSANGFLRPWPWLHVK